MEKKQVSDHDLMAYESMLEMTLNATNSQQNVTEVEKTQEGRAQEKSGERFGPYNSICKPVYNDSYNSAHQIASKWTAVGDMVARDVIGGGGGVAANVIGVHHSSQGSSARKTVASYMDDVAKVIEEAQAAAPPGGQARASSAKEAKKGVCYRRRRMRKRPLKKDEPLPEGGRRRQQHHDVVGDMPLLTESSDEEVGN